MKAFEIFGRIVIDGMDQAEKGLKGLEANLKRNEKGFKALAIAGGALAGAVALIGGMAIKTASDFESAFAGVRKTVEATEAEYGVLARGIRDLSKQMPTAATEIAAVAEAAGQLGIEKDSILAFSKVMIQLGQTTNLTATQAATQLARLSNIMGTSGEDFERLGSAIVNLGNNMATTEAEIVNMAMRLAGAGKTVGMVETDILGLAGAMSALGLESELGGSAVSRSLLTMRSAVTSGGENLQTFAHITGVSGAEFSKAFEEDATGALIAFIEGLKRLDDAGHDTTAMLEAVGLGGIRIQDTLLRAANNTALLTDAQKLGADAWAENTALSVEAAKRNATFASQLAITKNKVLDVGITIGGPLISALGGLLKLLSPVIELTGKLAGANEYLTMGALLLVGAGGVLLLLVGLLPRLVKGINSAIAGYHLLTGATVKNTVATAGHTIALVAHKIALVASAAATGLVTAAQWAWNVAMTANPIGLIIVGIGALIAGLVLLVKNFDKVKNWVLKNWDIILAAIVPVVGLGILIARRWDSIWSAVTGVFWKAADKILAIADKMLGWVPGLGNKIKDARKHIAGMIPHEAVEESAEKTEAAISKVEKAAQELLEQAKELYEGMKLTAMSIEEQAQAIAEGYSAYLDGIASLITAYQDGQTMAGRLGVSVEDVTNYIIAQGRAAELSAMSMEDWLAVGDDANKLAEKFKVSLQDVSYWSTLTTDRMIKDVEDLTRKAQNLAADRVRAEKWAIDERLKAEEESHSTKMDMLKDEYDETLRTIDAQLQDKLNTLNVELDNVDQQIEDILASREWQRLEERKGELELALSREFDMEKRAELEQELDKLVAESRNEQWIAERKTIYARMMEITTSAGQREAIAENLADFEKLVGDEQRLYDLNQEKQAIKDREKELSDEATDDKDRAQEVYDKKKELADLAYADLVTLLENQKAVLDTALTETQARYDAELLAFQTLLSDKTKSLPEFVGAYNSIMEGLTKDIAVETTLKDTGPFATSYNSFLDSLPDNVDINTLLGNTTGFMSAYKAFIDGLAKTVTVEFQPVVLPVETSPGGGTGTTAPAAPAPVTTPEATPAPDWTYIPGTGWGLTDPNFEDVGGGWWYDAANNRLINRAGDSVPLGDMADFPGYAQGGLITKPTLGMIGENASTTPEIISPVKTIRDIVRSELERAAGINVTINQENYVRDEADITIMTRKLQREIDYSLSARGL